MIDIRCERCDRQWLLSVKRLLTQYGADGSVRHIMTQQIGSCPNRNAAQLQSRCDRHYPTLVQLFGVPDPG